MLNNELKEAILKMNNYQKRELCSYVILSLSQTSEKERGIKVRTIMDNIIGESINKKLRTPRLVWARSMVAYQLRQEGMTFQLIADILERTTATVLRMEKNVQDMIDYPDIFKSVIPLWIEFKSALNETN